ncbi:MAG: peptidoglycan-binding protein [Candidatus Eremiobacterota bacterium]
MRNISTRRASSSSTRSPVRSRSSSVRSQAARRTQGTRSSDPARSARTTDRVQLSREARESKAGEAGGSELARNIAANYAPAFQGTRSTPAVDRLSLGQGELLRRGSEGSQVEQVQRMLNQRGANLEVDGQMGSQTARAVREFQQKNGLRVDGIVGPETQGALNDPGRRGQADPTRNEAPRRDQTDPSGNEAPRNQTGDPGSVSRGLERLPAPMQHLARDFTEAGQRYGIDPRFLAAVSMLETGRGTSNAFRNKNNAMGVSNRRGPISFQSHRESIFRMARTLANPNGYYAGKHTINRIAGTYAPVGAANDPHGTNGYWASGVRRYYSMLGGDPNAQVKNLPTQ